MRHRRSIDLTKTPDPPVIVDKPKEVGDLYDIAGRFSDLSGWALIGGRCARCEREGWIDRDWLEAKYPSVVISDLAGKLRCRKCGHKGGNRWILGKPPR
ncbi:hypothetical protein HJB89_25250 [Rhizobium sp. NZLR8]|uniref:hypothetical protein n=1 Tax=Rhizobium sp. NZLR8 TaxID=2731104 RepID=UPI001C833AC7|nr:hypothetical protein [Rhizobium sp. NZLR8]MBX5160394.1 hypothetical protein [Rhizobium sp. NZLR8]